MVKQFIKLKQFTRESNKGFTLLELLVALLVASIVLGLALTLIVDQRKLFVQDKARTQTNQNLRAVMDLVGSDIKQAGERLVGDTQLPVVRVINGASGAPDELVLQRKVINEILPVCQTITAGTSQSTIDVAVNPGTTACPFSDGNTDTWPDNLGEWRSSRCSKDGNSACARNINATNGSCIEQGGTDRECLWAYIHDPVNNRGEFFLYAFEDLNSTRHRIHRSNAGNWQNTYTFNAATPTTNPRLYILEERRYRLGSNPSISGDKVLELVLNRQTTPTIRLVNQLSDFQLVAVMQDNTTQDGFNDTTTNNWQQLKAIRVNLTARNPSQGFVNIPNLTLSAQFFPRNASSR